jgi:aminoglycoside phosphotransferase (APT) family kinase protein
MVDQLTAGLLAVLRARTGIPTLEYAAPPERLAGGFWAELIAFRLTGAPDGLTGDLVARVMPDPTLARKETVIQAEVANQEFPTPTVHLSGGEGDGLGRPFMVMDRVGGAPLLAGLDGVGALPRLPRLLGRISETLAGVMAHLHRLDPAPVRARLEEGGDAIASVAALLEKLRDTAELLARGDLVRAAGWLAANPPPPAQEVICHGDLHPFNLLVDPAGRITVLDWSAGLVAPRAYDVAFTSLVLAEPPLAVPRPARVLVRTGGRLLARRFRRRYRHHSGAAIDVASLRWHQGVVCLRVLVEVAGWVRAGELGAKAGHPWLVCGPAFASRLSALTGVPVRPR